MPDLFRGAVITIDGPAGSGKSTTARLLAQRLGFDYLDTGAMYRAVTLLASRRRCDLDDDLQVSALLAEADRLLRLEYAPAPGVRVFLGDEEITAAIREPLVDREVSAVSALPAVRRFLVRWQRRRAEQGNVVLEGRDTGTVVWPVADVKIYLEASLSERAARRARQAGGSSGGDKWAADLARRDRADSERAHSPLRRAPDAVVVDTTHMTIEEQVAAVFRICAEKLAARRAAPNG